MNLNGKKWNENLIENKKTNLVFLKKAKIKRTLNEDWNKRKTKKKIRKINLQQLFKKGKQRKIIIIKCKIKKTPAVKWEEEEQITAK